ncbi:MAG: GIY-YIG nuclease family protein [Parvibaculum sp.]
MTDDVQIEVTLPQGDSDAPRRIKRPGSSLVAFTSSKDRSLDLVAPSPGWNLAGRPVVYLLIQPTHDATRPIVYVGETEHLEQRLLKHRRTKNWSEIIVFSQEDLFDKACCRYLEYRAHWKINHTDRAELLNSKAPELSLLERGRRGPAETTLKAMGLLLSFIKYPLFERLSDIERRQRHAANSGPQFFTPGRRDVPTFELAPAGARGSATGGPGGIAGDFVVYAPSEVASSEQANCSEKTAFLRWMLENESVLQRTDSSLSFTTNHAFASQELAREFVLGGPNGPKWTSANTGQTVEAWLNANPHPNRPSDDGN